MIGKSFITIDRDSKNEYYLNIRKAVSLYGMEVELEKINK